MAGEVHPFKTICKFCEEHIFCTRDTRTGLVVAWFDDDGHQFCLFPRRDAQALLLHKPFDGLRAA